MKRSLMGSREKKLFIKRFFPAGNYTWTVPAGCTEVEVFIVGGGGGTYTAYNGAGTGGSGGGYTKTYRGKGYVKPSSGTWMGAYYDGRDGDAIKVTNGQSISIIVGAGGNGANGRYSQFMNANYRAEGGEVGNTNNNTGGNGGSGGGGGNAGNDRNGGSDGADGGGTTKGKGQGHTTRDFGEPHGKINAAGGGAYGNQVGGESDYIDGKGENGGFRSDVNLYGGYGGGGYGGGAGSIVNSGASSNKGGDGTVLIRYWAYEE